MTLRRLWLAAGCGIIGAIVWLSATPSPPELEVTQGDKVGHVLAYALLMFWFCQLHAARAARLAYAAGFLALGIGLELVQGALGYRSLEGWDVLADAIGVAAGWLGATLFRPGILERFARR